MTELRSKFRLGSAAVWMLAVVFVFRRFSVASGVLLVFLRQIGGERREQADSRLWPPTFAKVFSSAF